jgi:tagaturonate epimerase
MSIDLNSNLGKVSAESLLVQLEAALAGGTGELATVDGVYAESVKYSEGDWFVLARTDAGKRLAVLGSGSQSRKFEGEGNAKVKLCPLNTANSQALRDVFSWTAPVPIGRKVSFGTGDRLGVATPGHLRAFAGYDVYPVLAQQSMREMGRTKRSAQDVIDDAGWGVFEAGYTATFAADADHIKQKHEVLDCHKLGYTMFTIDASEHINAEVVNLSDSEVIKRFEELPEADELKGRYLGREWHFAEGKVSVDIAFTPVELAKCSLVYLQAAKHMADLYEALSVASGGSEGFDYEVSVDETETDTTVQDHLFVATELQQRGVKWQSLAPKFTGQFQKGIDYIGDKAEFERQFARHALLAKELGPYKVSVHSGSDKFSIFPLVGQYTDGYFHLKTAGTSWLEAVRVISVREPSLYREMHDFALEHFEEDRASYHVTTDVAKIPALDTLSDSELPALMDQIDPRQLLHITYGSLLSTQDSGGEYIYRDRIYGTLYDYEDDYYEALRSHIGRHVETLGVKRS